MQDDRDPIAPFDDEVPPRLAEDLKAIFHHPVQIASETDEAILRAAGAAMSRRKNSLLLLRWAGAGAAAAAAILLIALQFIGPSATPAPTAKVLRPSDIDGNGTVNIIDAFVVAKAIEHPGQTQKQWDLNHDGTVNKLDVDQIAMAAVTVTGGQVQ